VPVPDELDDHVTAAGNAELPLFLRSAEHPDVDYDTDTNEFRNTGRIRECGRAQPGRDQVDRGFDSV
jgi:hypothetical protein